MDAGAIAKPESICNLFFAMVQDPKIGGVCGTMRIDLSTKNSKGDNVYKDIFTKYLSRIFSVKRC
jgi:cellulose synthase/poly-beta-1,6-N-acetylglucosamine synthase-like glycosyltransferase